MKTKSILCTLSAIAALPVLSFAQTATETTSPTSSADGGVQTQEKPNTEELKHRQNTTDPGTDAPHLSPTNTQRGGTMDTGSPHDNVDKNPNVEKATSSESNE